MYLLVLKKLFFILGLTTLTPFLGMVPKPVAAVEQNSIILQEVRSENELNVLHEKFSELTQCDKSKVEQVIKVRIAEEGSLVPFKRNIDATLILWDAGVRDPYVFMATLLKDTQIDQTVIVHLYGPEVISLLNEMQSPSEAQISDNAKKILTAFEQVDSLA